MDKPIAILLRKKREDTISNTRNESSDIPTDFRYIKWIGNIINNFMPTNLATCKKWTNSL